MNDLDPPGADDPDGLKKWLDVEYGEKRPVDHYADAFYAIGDMLRIPASTSSPKDVFEREMKPKLQMLMDSYGAEFEADEWSYEPNDAVMVGIDTASGRLVFKKIRHAEMQPQPSGEDCGCGLGEKCPARGSG